jgi:membrane protein DedA with SNARE-associated domain
MPDITAPLVNFAVDQIGAYGLVAVLLLMAVQAACIPLVPSEAVMLYGGFLVGTGEQVLGLVILAGVAGDLAGSFVAYWLGRARGREWLLRLKWLHITPRRLDMVDRWFARTGGWAVLIVRCVPLLRSFISLPAGISRMSFPRFAIFTLLGSLPWVAAWTIFGRAVGHNWESIQHNLHYADYGLVAAIAIGAAVIVWRRRGRTHAVAAAEPAAETAS